MKALKVIAPVALALVATVASANATDARESARTTTKVRQVNYSCSQGGKVSVKYGFNKQNLPTYAEANLGGKTRFMPINLAHSDIGGTTFGDEDSYSLGTEAMTLNNYNKLSIATIQNQASEITHKDCRVLSTKKIKG